MVSKIFFGCALFLVPVAVLGGCSSSGGDLNDAGPNGEDANIGRVVTFAGTYSIVAAVQFATAGSQNCSAFRPFAEFRENGRIAITNSGILGTLTPSNGLQEFTGAFFCEPGDIFSSRNQDFGLSFQVTDGVEDPNTIQGSILLRVPGSQVIPCSVSVQAVR